MTTKLIGLTGAAGSGKSEAAAHLVDKHGYRVVKFAGPLKAMLRAFYRELGVSEELIERRIEGDLKEEPCAYLGGHTPRHAMQTLGTEWGRNCISPQFWIHAWFSAAQNVDGPVAVDDVRFDNEAHLIESLGGSVIALQPKKRRRKGSQHVAEAGISPEYVHQTVTNGGTIEDLKKAIDVAIEAPV